MSDLSERLKMLRKNKKVNQEEVAEACGLSRVSIARYENGLREPEPYVYARLAEYYGVSTDFLLGREESMHSRLPTDDEIKFALFGGDAEITDAQFEEVKRFAQFVKMREEREELGHKQ